MAVALGTWGCLSSTVINQTALRYSTAADGRRHQRSSHLARRPPAIPEGLLAIDSMPNVVIFQGKAGNGKPLMQSRTKGQVWAVDAQVDEASGAAYVAVGSWSICR